jgi:predicted acylesterase/phospholipase RssA
MKNLLVRTILLFLTSYIYTEANGGGKANPISFTISGGVSLGSYQGGYAYYASKVLKEQTKYHIVQVTGASAGSINSFLLAASICLDSESVPEQSLFYKAWTDIGIKELREGENLSAFGLFTQDNIRDTAKSLLNKIWQSRPSLPCSVLVGITVTRRDVKKYYFSPELAVPHQEEKISFMLKYDNHWHINPVIIQGKSGPKPILGFGRGSEEDKEVLLDLLMASSAFPGAFPPQELKIANADTAALKNCGKGWNSKHITNLWDSISSCSSSLLDTSDFLDGGVFENRPLRLAYNLSKINAGDRSAFSDSMLFVYLDQDNKKYPLSTLASMDDTANTFFSNLIGFSSSFVESARNKELFSLFEEMHSSPDHILLSGNRIPPISEGLHAFAGFFDRDFRRFDFYLGMYDAYRDIKIRFGREAIINDSNFNCIKEDFQNPHLISPGPGSEIGSCKNIEGNFKLLIDESLKGVESKCTYYEISKRENNTTGRHLFSKYIKNYTKPSPELDSICREYLTPSKLDSNILLFYLRMTTYELLDFNQEMLKYGEEISFGDARFLNLVYSLQERGYKFKELGDESPLMKMKGDLLDIVDKAADRQPTGNRQKFNIVGKYFANSFLNRGAPPNWYLSGGQSGIDLGYNSIYFGNSFNPLLGLLSRQTISFQLGDFTWDHTNIAVLYGLNIPLATFQFEAGWAIGYATDFMNIHDNGFRNQLSIILCVFDRLRVQLMFSSVTTKHPTMNDPKLNLLIGYQFF